VVVALDAAAPAGAVGLLGFLSSPLWRAYISTDEPLIPSALRE